MHPYPPFQIENRSNDHILQFVQNNKDWLDTDSDRGERESRDWQTKIFKLGLDLKLWSGEKWGLEVSFPPRFLIASDKQPVHAIKLESSSKNVNKD